MRWIKVFALLFFTWLLCKPLHGLAVTFTIPEVEIEAYVHADGHVEVVESYLYEFEGEFNGFTRVIEPTADKGIEDFSAYENGEPLPFEVEEGAYRMFRPGTDETVRLTIQYTIVNGVEKFEDAAQFNWSFIGRGNTSTYGKMGIVIYPPTSTTNVHALGYGITNGTDTVDEEGIVYFHLGTVKPGKKGEIRVAFPKGLFPQVIEKEGMIIEEIVLYDEERQATKEFGIVFTALLGCGLLLLFSWMVTAPRRRRKRAATWVNANRTGIPPEKISLSAILHFIYDHTIRMNGDGSIEVAALLELIRKGHIEQLTDDRFKLVDRTAVQNTHEEVLIHLLFDEIGDGFEFGMADLKDYVANKGNHRTYRKCMLKWKNGLEKELRKHKIIKRRLGIRLLFFGSSLLTALLMILFLNYELYGLMACHLGFSIVLFLTAIFYQPMALNGYILLEEWKQFRLYFRDPHSNLQELSFNDQLRAYTFAVGMGDKRIGQQANAFTDAVLSTMKPRGTADYANYASMSASFSEAGDAVSTTSGGSSGGGGSGGAGGGGGAGAF